MTRRHAEDPRCPSADIQPSAAERQARAWAMFLHLSVFGGFILPLAGFVAPILIWRLKRDEVPQIDPHGRALVNWLLSSTLYGALFVLVFALLPQVILPALAVLPVLAVLWVLSVVWLILPLIAAVRTHQGHEWRYPLAIPFFRGCSKGADPESPVVDAPVLSRRDPRLPWVRENAAVPGCGAGSGGAKRRDEG